ncbi:hypothetical protein VF04_38005 [Nostoc linckia z7]|uniref:Uncharacterized protein n=1 Tax=Nostoc linckia z7 TaxID=1628745 RepID=A0ABX4KI86_NOSLI|nr:hypothetical protein [Nostoc linckia]PHJ52338.1 hypothetical protein VF02_37645 [Nostoc linckia z1]PHJ59325.1 hypothetical protein VF05_32560 [Nostoc linckia z3]PHJ63650.1 hypothetical protein VF03_30070 [Nostoc linckia z2]PHJ80184.1 hypothetical protein VF04_38005 [Nostoc linckia z7]
MTPQEVMQKVYAEIDGGIESTKEEIKEYLREEDYISAGSLHAALIALETFKEKLKDIFPEE